MEKKCVNALYRAYSISTWEQYGMGDYFVGCQCPLSGLLHFYDNGKMAKLEDGKVCQCPLSGLLHFYPWAAESEDYYDSIVSMPFIGLTPFLLNYITIMHGK